MERSSNEITSIGLKYIENYITFIFYLWFFFNDTKSLTIFFNPDYSLANGKKSCSCKKWGGKTRFLTGRHDMKKVIKLKKSLWQAQFMIKQNLMQNNLKFFCTAWKKLFFDTIKLTRVLKKWKSTLLNDMINIFTVFTYQPYPFLTLNMQNFHQFLISFTCIFLTFEGEINWPVKEQFRQGVF